MGLSVYKKKRDFKKTPEPTGGKGDNSQLRFVVQKHDASHLHYDFRLEMEGVLKSWAVPKGPSVDPKVKRLAMMVEDHPFDYRDFEGIIPSGYGAGTVIVWDEGYYEPVDFKSTDKKARDKELRHQLYSGKIKFRLHGKKLKGEFALVKAHGRGENGWLLFKINDEYASKNDILTKDKSVISKKTLAQVENTTTNFYGAKRVKENKVISKKALNLSKKERVKKAITRNNKEKGKSSKKSIGSAGKPAKFPSKLTPMLATLVDKPFDEPGWVYEVKWDGYRTLAYCNKGKVELKSRNDKSFNDKFYPVKTALEKLKLNAVIDGEIVVVGDNGISNFGSLQNWRSEADGQLLFYIFDILWLDGKNVMNLPLEQRKELLADTIPENETVLVSKSFGPSGTEFFEAAKQMGLEGIIAKKANSTYKPGIRGEEWLKIKANKRQEMVIGGYTRNDDSSKAFSSLLLGVFKKGKLVYTGKVGTGFNGKTQTEMLKQFKKYVTKKSPFTELPDINKPSRFRPNPPHATATFLKPVLICEVSYAEMTSDGIMRHPSFEGMRIDKKAKEVIKEDEKSTAKIVKNVGKVSKEIIKTVKKGERKTLLNPTDETQVREINKHELKFTNLNKVYWPKEKVTKRDMLNYYYQVAPIILPYLKDRPQSLNRYPNGINGESFYQKDFTGKAPEWIKTFLYHSEADNRDRHYMVPTKEEDILYMASLGSIELNPWHSRAQSPDNPDWCIIDLDPDKNSFNQVIEAAYVTKNILDSIGAASYCKTSGSTGLHIYIPLGAKYTYEQSKEFGRVIATLVHNEIPKFTSIERQVKNRGGKMYIDFLQNRPQATIACAYSLRPKPGAPVSMPLHWEEVKKGIKIIDYNIFNAMDRIRNEGDIFKPVLGKGIDLKKCINRFRQ